jgi:hypothetical protein
MRLLEIGPRMSLMMLKNGEAFFIVNTELTIHALGGLNMHLLSMD